MFKTAARVRHHTTVICCVLFHDAIVGYIFGVDCQTTLQEQEQLISRLPVENYNYFVIVVSGYWASCPDTWQHRSSAKILFSRWKQRQKS